MASDLVELVGPSGTFTVTRKQADGVYAHFERAGKPKSKRTRKTTPAPDPDTLDSQE